MKRMQLLATIFLFAWMALPVSATAAPAPKLEASPNGSIVWLQSEDDAFAQAKRENKFVLLDLEAVWCHWCHVMDEKTYANPDVIAAVREHYVAWRVDQDSRPDLAQRFGDWGWPATIFFAADGTEIVKKRGYVPPTGFLALLQAIVDDPSPINYMVEHDETLTEASDSLSSRLRTELKKRYASTFDARLGGLDIFQKFLDHDSVEYALHLAQNGDAKERAAAKLTLDNARALLDPAWGGFYQYSTENDWQHPHFEKLAALQGAYLRSYAMAYAAFDRDSAYSRVEHAVIGYLDAFLRSPDGAFYASQDADLKRGEHSAEYFDLDDKSRRALGIPRVDKHVYSSYNGSIIEGLAAWHEASGEQKALDMARTAARWIIAHRAMPKGGFRHDESDATGPYLGDTLAMGRAFLALYRADADRDWLRRANAAAAFIDNNFRNADGGYNTAVAHGTIPSAPVTDEIIPLVRFANLLAFYSGDTAHTAMAKHGMRWLDTAQAALRNASRPGILLADVELANPTLHVTVIGAKDDPKAAELFAQLQRLPNWYKRIDWWDRSEGPLPNPDVQYPQTKRAAAFVCTDRRCSLPLYDGDAIAQFLKPASDG